MNAADRFFAKVAPGPNGCLLWTGAVSGDGYGIFTDKGRTMPAHRWLLERVYGRNEGLVADHLCRTPACVRPSHLEFVTYSENVLRGVMPARARARAAARTHCKHGHELTAENLYLYVSKRGKTSRMCKTCMNANRKTHARKSAIAAATRFKRWNRALLEGDPRVAILHSPSGPLVHVQVFAGDTDADLDAARVKAVEIYKATRAAVRVMAEAGAS